METVNNVISNVNVDHVTVLGGCTKYIQAPDVCWNRSFNAFVTEQYDEWMASGLQQYTEAGNLKPPSRRTILQWILAALGKVFFDINFQLIQKRVV